MQRYAARVGELRLNRRTAVPGITLFASSCHRGNIAGGIHLANAMVVPIGDVDVAQAIRRHVFGERELRLNRRPIVSAIAPLPGSCHRGNVTRGIHFADAVIAGIGNVEVARIIHRHAAGVVKLRLDCRAAVPAVTPLSGSRYRGDDAPCIHLADAVIAGIGDVEATRIIYSYAVWMDELRLSRWPVVADLFGSHHCGDDARDIHLAYAVIVGIGDVDVAQAIRRHVFGERELRLNRRPIVSVIAPLPGSCHRGNIAGGIHLADAMVVVFDNVNVARTVHRHATRVIKLRLDCRAAVPAVIGFPGSHHRGDVAGGIHLADTVVSRIGDVEVAHTVRRHAAGERELRLNRRAAVPTVASLLRFWIRLPCSRHCGNVASGIHLADSMAFAFDNVEIAHTVQCHATGREEAGLDRRAAVPAAAPLSGSSHRRDITSGIHLADAVIATVGDIEIVPTVHHHALGQIEARLSRRPSIISGRNPGNRHNCPLGYIIHCQIQSFCSNIAAQNPQQDETAAP